MISRVRQKTNRTRTLPLSWPRRLSILTMMTRANKLKRMTMRKAKSQPSSENRTNVDAESIGLWLVEITDYL